MISNCCARCSWSASRFVERARLDVTVYSFRSRKDFKAYSSYARERKLPIAGFYMARPDRAVMAARRAAREFPPAAAEANPNFATNRCWREVAVEGISSRVGRLVDPAPTSAPDAGRTLYRTYRDACMSSCTRSSRRKRSTASRPLPVRRWMRPNSSSSFPST